MVVLSNVDGRQGNREVPVSRKPAEAPEVQNQALRHVPEFLESRLTPGIALVDDLATQNPREGRFRVGGRRRGLAAGGAGPGSLAGRGGAPNAAEGGGVFRETCAQCHRYGTVGKDYAPDLTRVADRLQRRDILRSMTSASSPPN